VTQDEQAAQAFSSLLRQIQTEATQDPQKALAYNQPEVVRFFYLANSRVAPRDLSYCIGFIVVN
jgi:hypothetical protein